MKRQRQGSSTAAVLVAEVGSIEVTSCVNANQVSMIIHCVCVCVCGGGAQTRQLKPGNLSYHHGGNLTVFVKMFVKVMQHFNT